MLIGMYRFQQQLDAFGLCAVARGASAQLIERARKLLIHRLRPLLRGMAAPPFFGGIDTLPPFL